MLFEDSKNMFPSPFGDYFLTIIRDAYKTKIKPEYEFPSPSGDFFNKVPPAEITKYIAAEVFPSPSGDYFF